MINAAFTSYGNKGVFGVCVFIFFPSTTTTFSYFSFPPQLYEFVSLGTKLPQERLEIKILLLDKLNWFVFKLA